MEHSNEVMNIKQLASYLGCSESSIRKMIRKNILEFYKIGNRYLFRKDYVDNWIRDMYSDFNNQNGELGGNYNVYR